MNVRENFSSRHFTPPFAVQRFSREGRSNIFDSVGHWERGLRESIEEGSLIFVLLLLLKLKKNIFGEEKNKYIDPCFECEKKTKSSIWIKFCEFLFWQKMKKLNFLFVLILVTSSALGRRPPSFRIGKFKFWYFLLNGLNSNTGLKFLLNHITD